MTRREKGYHGDDLPEHLHPHNMKQSHIMMLLALYFYKANSPVIQTCCVNEHPQMHLSDRSGWSPLWQQRKFEGGKQWKRGQKRGWLEINHWMNLLSSLRYISTEVYTVCGTKDTLPLGISSCSSSPAPAVLGCMCRWQNGTVCHGHFPVPCLQKRHFLNRFKTQYSWYTLSKFKRESFSWS